MPTTYSPLRYPGGKSQLAKYVSHVLDLNGFTRNTAYCEAFCGGAGIAIKLLEDKRVGEIILNDYDIAIYSVWKAILEEPQRFNEKIKKTLLNIEEWEKQREAYLQLRDANTYNFDLAWATFYLNRTNRSGIIEGGPIGGKLQRGNYNLGCRFNRNALMRKVEKISTLKNRIKLYNLDGLDFIWNIIRSMRAETFFFFDPPYFKQGKNLYKNSLNEQYHMDLAKAIQNLVDKHWIVTYDDVPSIRKVYSGCDGWRYAIRYSANLKRRQEELIFKSKVTKIESYGSVELCRLP